MKAPLFVTESFFVKKSTIFFLFVTLAYLITKHLLPSYNTHNYCYWGFGLFVLVGMLMRFRKLTLSAQDLLLGSYAAYLISRTFIEGNFGFHIDFLLPLSLFFAYLFLRTVRDKNSIRLLLLGLSILVGFHFVFDSLGIGDFLRNYVPLLGTNRTVAGCIFVLSLPLLLALREQATNKQGKTLFSTLFVVFILLILLSQSRSAWVALVLYALFYAKEKKEMAFRLKHYLLLLALALPLSFAGYHLKPESALGRVHTARITARMIGEAPLLGVGYGNFATAYAQAQRSYFQTHPTDSPEAFLADAVRNAFNDPLEEWACGGLVGFLLFYLYFFLQFRKSGSLEGKSLLLLYLVCSLFYAARSVPLLLFFLAFAYSLQNEGEKGLPWGSSVARFSAVPFAVLLGIFVQASLVWNQGFMLYSKGEAPAKTVAYYLRHSDDFSLRHNGLFLQSVGIVLEKSGKKRDALRFYQKATRYFESYSLWVSLGRLHEELSMPQEAEKAYLSALHLVPHKLTPRFSLMRLHHTQGHKTQALRWAKEVVATPMKIHTKQGSLYKKRAQQLLSSNRGGISPLFSQKHPKAHKHSSGCSHHNH